MPPENVNYPPGHCLTPGAATLSQPNREKAFKTRNKAELSGVLLQNENPGSVPPSAKAEKAFNHYAPFIETNLYHIIAGIVAQKIPLI